MIGNNWCNEANIYQRKNLFSKPKIWAIVCVNHGLIHLVEKNR
jgi:hypothetical protein